MKKSVFLTWLVLLVILPFQAAAQETRPVDYAVQVSAEVQETPPQITLVWPPGRFDTTYTVSRKLPQQTQWSRLADLPSGSTRFVDSNVAVGQGYEYQIRKGTTRGFTGYGYIYAGIKLPLVENRGKVIVLVQSTHAEPLSAELARLTQDLAGDGWEVVQIAVRPDIQATEVKSVVRGIYDSDPGQVKALFIVGHVPVPYSGNIFPDDHVHQGAWPADVYYADMNGQWKWTDFVVNLRTRNYPVNRNIPGDRKFDQSYPPAADLQVGRVDFWNMPVFQPRSEVDLLRQYLDKNHNFRHGRISVPRRGLIADFLPKGFVPTHSDGDGDPVGNSGWRNFSAFFGPENIREVGVGEYFPNVTREGFLWAFGGSVSRSFDATDGIGSSANFAANHANVVFTMFVGGFYGDWNTENNLMRAALGSGNVLTASYSGLPHWYYHHMALGETIGYSTRLTQLNGRGGTYPPVNDGGGQVHIALMGDPTLRMHPVIPPANLSASVSGGVVDLSWSPSQEQALEGYHVYRSSTPQGPFQRITGATPIRETQFQGSAGSDPATYMVRAIKLERSASGTYLNGSQGIFVTVGEGAAPAAPSNLQARALSSSVVLLTWTDQSNNETGFRIDRRIGNGDFTQLAVVNPNVTAFMDRERAAETAYTYRVSAFNLRGTSSPSNLAQATTLPSVKPLPQSRAAFVRSDTQTRGAWTGRYGNEGYYVVTKEDVAPHGAPSIWPSDPIIPIYAEVQPIGKQTYIWSGASIEAGHSLMALPTEPRFRPMHGEDHVEIYPLTTDVRALQRERGLDQRMASAWFAPEKFSLELTVDDPKPRHVSFYFVDWDRQGRSQRIEVFGQNGQLLDSRTVSGFENGIYYTWEVQGPVRFDFTRLSGPNALIMGFFFDSANGPGEPQPPVTPTPPSAPSNLTATALSSSQVRLTWSDNSDNEAGFRLERRSSSERFYALVTTLPANTTSYTDSGLAADTAYFYIISAHNEHGQSEFAYSAEARTLDGPSQPPPPPPGEAEAQFLGVDTSTGGNWSGVYGQEGHLVLGGTTSLPIGATVSASGKSDFSWSSPGTDLRALQRSPNSAERVASAWYSASSFTIHLDLAQRRDIALYFVDWDRAGREQLVEMIDPANGQILNSQTVSSFGEGKYLLYNLRGRVDVRVTRTSGPNAVFMGLFLGNDSPAPATLSLQVQRHSPTQIKLRISGPAGASFVLESSQDLRDWSPVSQANFGASPHELDQMLDGTERAFYRARIQ
jgi:hypothetical protein